VAAKTRADQKASKGWRAAARLDRKFARVFSQNESKFNKKSILHCDTVEKMVL
jgi:hypothetical protein